MHGSNNQVLLANNRITRVMFENGENNFGIEIWGGGNSGIIANNYCKLNWSGRYIWSAGSGIHVRDSINFSILNNIVVGARHGIEAPFGTVAKNNLYSGLLFEREVSGVVAEGSIGADPLFVADQAPKLQPNSPCINAGTADARYNDRDGSRNDIGPSGGAWFDPDGWTTENPVVISFDLSPDQVLEGVEPEIILSEGLAVSAP